LRYIEFIEISDPDRRIYPVPSASSKIWKRSGLEETVEGGERAGHLYGNMFNPSLNETALLPDVQINETIFR
jgi:hypothetical protein